MEFESLICWDPDFDFDLFNVCEQALIKPTQPRTSKNLALLRINAITRHLSHLKDSENIQETG